MMDKKRDARETCYPHTRQKKKIKMQEETGDEKSWMKRFLEAEARKKYK